ncbi:MAG: DUF4625 domain-containing protein [Bacteroidales bacterium]|jgi:hypothetical protein|nr:DUF4625 domain-containing protein [Bacteroidales bacterium]OPZ95521.1 MAG: hypothetical protein BWY72_02073 [Bacteroidetes bacterium ADurb.Bin416]
MKQMNAKIHLLVLLGLIIATPIFTACDSNDHNVDKPSITLSEVGLNNSKIGTISADLHLQAEIVALGRINTVTVDIHAETSGGGELDTTYTEFEGLRSTSFHKHIDIPSTFEPGNYHLHFSVTDQLGQQSTVETEITLQL